MKFGRTYQAVIQGQQQTWDVKYPFTCRFRVSSTGTPTANVAKFFFYNLPEQCRNDLIKDIFESLEYRRMTFAAGYESQPTLPVIFVGNVFWAYSYRSGPDWITEIEALDGGWSIENSHVTYSAPAGVEFKQILRAIALTLQNITPGLITNSLGVPATARGEVAAGNSWAELIKRILPLNAMVYIDQERVNIIAQNEYIPAPGALDEISDDTGMIGSPRRQANMTIASLIFEPRLMVGQKIALRSSQPYSGDHKVMMVDHQGTISPTVSEDLTTRATFFRTPDLREVAL